VNLMSTVSLPAFVDMLRSTELLDPRQWQQVEDHLAESSTAAELARELVRRGWLTAYQANQLNRGKRAVSGGEDGVIRLWDVDSGKELGRSEQHSRPITSVAFSPAGFYALSGSRDRTVGLWKLP
jgi:hypothetical protein